MNKLVEIKDLVQEAFDKGATSVEQVHKFIANMPLQALEKIEPIEGPVKDIKEFQERSIGSIYDTIRLINQQAAELASDLINRKDNK